jgi:hypothetical protein
MRMRLQDVQAAVHAAAAPASANLALFSLLFSQRKSPSWPSAVCSNGETAAETSHQV